MSNTSDAFLLANTVDFQKRVRLLLANVAADVLAESGSTSSHDTRAAYARTVIADLARQAERATLVVVARNLAAAAAAQQGGGHEGFSDAVVKSAIASVFNTLAGVSESEPIV